MDSKHSPYLFRVASPVGLMYVAEWKRNVYIVQYSTL